MVHVTQHRWGAAQARFGEGSQSGRDWLDAPKTLLLSDEASAVIAEVVLWHPRQEGKRRVREQLLGYLREHEKRLGYTRFAGAGYHIGSGVAECGCKNGKNGKNVVQLRMKGLGMRWSQTWVEAQLQLGSTWKSAGATDFHRFTAN